MVDPEAALALAERVAETARGLGIETAVIGALAGAAHRYVRATTDVDLAAYVDPRMALPGLEDALREQGLHARLRMPDADDPLGGVLVVWEREDEEGEAIDEVELVNFNNPFAPRPTPAANAIRNALPIDEKSSLRYVRLPDLIALKLYAGGRSDLADIVELLARNPDADLDEIRRIAQPYDGQSELETLIAEAAAKRRP